MFQFSNERTQADQTAKGLSIFALVIPSHKLELEHVGSPSSTFCSLRDLPQMSGILISSFMTQYKQCCIVSLRYWGCKRITPEGWAAVMICPIPKEVLTVHLQPHSITVPNFTIILCKSDRRTRSRVCLPQQSSLSSVPWQQCSKPD